MVFIKRVFAVFMLCLLTACTVSNNDKSITDIIGHFKESGLNVGKVSSKFSQMVMASDGAGIEIDGREVEIYKYDLNKADQKLTLEKIKKENKIELMGIVVSAKVNGSFVMINYSEHPQQAKLIDIFMNFTGKTAKAADSGGAISSKQPANNPAQIKDTPPPTPASGEKSVITDLIKIEDASESSDTVTTSNGEYVLHTNNKHYKEVKGIIKANIGKKVTLTLNSDGLIESVK